MGMPTLAPPAAETRPVDPDSRFCFAVLADPDPGALPRLMELFAKRWLVPTSVQSRLVEGELAVDLQVPGLARAEGDHIARQMRTIPFVRQVLMSERHRPEEPAALVA
ncbi:MAG TPA: hypothetical protein VEB20_12520 [Azospirillaceae bacterium]|nr:hypothetical protein [Azospirillaceae bacterium]